MSEITRPKMLKPDISRPEVSGEPSAIVTVPDQPTSTEPQRHESISLIPPNLPSYPASGQKTPRSSRASRASRRKSATMLTRSGSNRTSRTSSRNRSQRSGAIVLYCLRLLIFGVGMSVIAGSVLSSWDPSSHSLAGASQTAVQQVMIRRPFLGVNQASSSLDAKLTAEIIPLKAEIQALAAQEADLRTGAFFVDLDTGTYVDLNGTSEFSAASMIKVPVLVAFFQDVDAGKVRLDEILVMRPDLIASGSGTMQFRTPGTQFTALETVTKMITISDNTATNMLIDRLGGMKVLNERFKAWGLPHTVIRNPLPDLEGTNTSSPRDMANLMTRISQGDLVSLRSRDRLLDIMRRTETDTLLPRGLDDSAAIAHKTGDIGSLVGDVGLIDVPNGKRYVGVAMVKRPHNDSRAQELIRQISKVTYQTFSQPISPDLNPNSPRARGL